MPELVNDVEIGGFLILVDFVEQGTDFRPLVENGSTASLLSRFSQKEVISDEEYLLCFMFWKPFL